MSESIDWEKRLEHCQSIISNWDELTSHEKVGRLLIGAGGGYSLARVLEQVVPEHKDFWLRVQAEIEHRYRGFMEFVLTPDNEPVEPNTETECCPHDDSESCQSR